LFRVEILIGFHPRPDSSALISCTATNKFLNFSVRKTSENLQWLCPCTRRTIKSGERNEHEMKTRKIGATIALIATAAGGGELAAKDKDPKTGPAKSQDRIAIEAHIAFSDGPVTHFVATQHYGRSYVYAEREAGKPVTLIDITNPAHPRVLANTSLEAPSGSLLVVDGTAAPVQTIRLMNFSDPANPKVTKQFEGVTAVEKVGRLTLLANGDGIWILSEHRAVDPSVDERYAKKIIYGESMY
jgi:hypothetical protein